MAASSEFEVPAFCYGCDKDLQLAYRYVEEDQLEPIHWEMSLPLQVLDGQEDDDLVTALWRDGDTWDVASLTVQRFREALDKNTCRREEPIWRDVHTTSGHELNMVLRPDRGLLLSLMEQGAQICGVRVKFFGDLPDGPPKTVPRSHPALVACIAFMIPLAERYAKAEFADAKALKAEKDLLLAPVKAELRKANAAGKAAAKAAAKAQAKAAPAPPAAEPAATTTAAAPQPSTTAAAPLCKRRRIEKKTIDMAQALIDPISNCFAQLPGCLACLLHACCLFAAACRCRLIACPPGCNLLPACCSLLHAATTAYLHPAASPCLSRN